MMFARPVAAHHRHLFCIRLVQGCVINDQNTFGFQDKLFNLLPECSTIRWNALKQSRIGVMRRCANFTRNNLRGFHCAEHTLSCQQELDVIVFVYFLRVHSLSLITLYQLRKSYKDKIILKGGMLIASMIGIGSRTTMDMDATVRGYPLSDEAIQNAFAKICSIPLNDDVILTLNSITPIRDEDEYGGFRLMINAKYETINTPLKVDITTGDIITPEAVRYTFHSSFEEKKIEIWAYNIETILAEKVETILRRSVLNTRPRDFYDVYILMKTHQRTIDKDIFITALNATAQKRVSLTALQDQRKILQAIQADSLLTFTKVD
jgi:predicted nucleotidyltransferase component of viral defense system